MREEWQALIELAVREDLGPNDATGDLVRSRDGSFVLRSRQAGILAGAVLIPAVLTRVAAEIGAPVPGYSPLLEDGANLEPKTAIGLLGGNTRCVLAAERILLNFVTHLSGVATATASCVLAAAGKAVIRDTRKTLPGYRSLEKYAVTCGGGQNHRMGLYDAILIKDNHLALEPMGELLARARATYPELPVEVEVDSLEQLKQAICLAVPLVLLDNFPVPEIYEAVKLAKGTAIRLEVSGGVVLSAIPELAATGVDYLAVGQITHSAPALDIGLDEA